MLLTLLKAGPGHVDPDLLTMLAFACVIYLLLLGCWAFGYWMGSREKAAVLDGALGASLAIAFVGLWPETVFLLAAIPLALWIWVWSAAGYAFCSRYGIQVCGGWWGGCLGPLGIGIAVWIAESNKAAKAKPG